MADDTGWTASRRRVLRGAAWSTPLIVASTAVPAVAASLNEQRLGVVFDGGGGANGYFNSMYLNLKSATGQNLTLKNSVTITLEIVGLNKNATDERSMTVGSSYGTITRTDYNPSSLVTRIVWTLPAGTVVPTTAVGTANPDILFTFRDGASSQGRITNKVVIRSIAGGAIVEPGSLPVDSSVVKDYNPRAVSPDGIY